MILDMVPTPRVSSFGEDCLIYTKIKRRCETITRVWDCLDSILCNLDLELLRVNEDPADIAIFPIERDKDCDDDCDCGDEDCGCAMVKLNILRNQRNITQSDLAEKMKASQRDRIAS